MSQHHRSGGWTGADSKLWRERIGAQLPLPCTKCGQWVTGEMEWQVDHILSLAEGGEKSAENLGPAHRRCNASAGGKAGAAVTNQRRKAQQQEDQRTRPW